MCVLLCSHRSTFFKDFHAALVEVLQGALTHKGMVFMFNPARHGSLDRFADLTRQAGLETLVEYHYDDVVWARHQQLTEAAGTPAEVRTSPVGRRRGWDMLERL
jgi:hypothetical protein